VRLLTDTVLISHEQRPELCPAVSDCVVLVRVLVVHNLKVPELLVLVLVA
jgi:hypothetical protein